MTPLVPRRAADLWASRRQQLKVFAHRALDELELRPRLTEMVRVDNGVLRIGDQWAHPVDRFRDVRVLAVGKAGGRMARVVLDQLAPLAEVGGEPRCLVVSNTHPSWPPPHVKVITAGHPEPDAGSLHAADEALRFLADCSDDTLVLFLISGGGSALLEKLLDDDIPADDVAALHRLLVTSHLDIVTINTVRKHLSAVKGGRLAAAAQPAEQVTLFVSDVPEGADSTVASGPTMPDETTVADCLRVLGDNGLLDRLPHSVRRLLDSDLPETPKPGDPALARSTWLRVASNCDGVHALARLVREAGFTVREDLSADDQPVDEVVPRLLATLDEMPAPAALVTGGEVICPVRGNGVGGRNLEFVLRAALRIDGRPIAVLSFGTDGIDGNSPAAGAVADGTTVARASVRRLDAHRHLDESNAYPLLDALGDAIVTGPTGHNVRDLRLLIKWPAE